MYIYSYAISEENCKDIEKIIQIREKAEHKAARKLWKKFGDKSVEIKEDKLGRIMKPRQLLLENNKVANMIMSEKKLKDLKKNGIVCERWFKVLHPDFVCPACNKTLKLAKEEMNYCYHCGAKIIKEDAM